MDNFNNENIRLIVACFCLATGVTVSIIGIVLCVLFIRKMRKSEKENEAKEFAVADEVDDILDMRWT